MIAVAPPAARRRHAEAVLLLLVANLFWGLSFPLIKGVVLAGRELVPDGGTAFVTAMTVAPRFLLATLALGAVAWRQVASVRGAELRQGVLLGLATGAGMFFQNDGLQFTSASVSAFLTQFYAVLIPLVEAVRHRRRPSGVTLVCCLLVLAGSGILARFDVRTLALGRGEIETLVSSLFFMGQILVLADPRFAGNRTLAVTTVMFATEAVAFSVLALAVAPRAAAVLVPWSSAPWLGCTALLTVFCTIGAFTLMNRWQPLITATEAGLIYCSEPIFASALALFLPGWLSRWAGFAYANESVGWPLLAGGGLITAANVLIQLRPPERAA